jgi:hypothetical protein
VRLETPGERVQSATRLREHSRRLLDEAQRKARLKGWRVRSRAETRPFALQFLRNGYPIYYGVCNYNAAISTAADQVRLAAPYDLTGLGVRVGVWDEGGVRASHIEFTERVILADGAEMSNHATHMAGTIASSGFDAQAIGLAPLAWVCSYGWEEDDAEMVLAAAGTPRQTDKIYLSNHSYAILAGWESGVDLSGYEGPHWVGVKTEDECQYFGQYDSISASWDAICHSARYFLPFKSAGTQRNDLPPEEGEVFYYFDMAQDDWTSKTYDPAVDPPGDGETHEGFDTITDAGCAKNVLTGERLRMPCWRVNGRSIWQRWPPSAGGDRPMTGVSNRIWWPMGSGCIRPVPTRTTVIRRERGRVPPRQTPAVRRRFSSNNFASFSPVWRCGPVRSKAC